MFATVLATVMGTAPQNNSKEDESAHLTKGWGNSSTTGAPMIIKELHNGVKVNKSHHRHHLGFKRFGTKLNHTTPVPNINATKTGVKDDSKKHSHRFIKTMRNYLKGNRHFNATMGNQTQHNNHQLNKTIQKTLSW